MTSVAFCQSDGTVIAAAAAAYQTGARRAPTFLLRVYCQLIGRATSYVRAYATNIEPASRAAAAAAVAPIIGWRAI